MYEQYVHCKVEDLSINFSAILTVMYAKNELVQREVFRFDLLNIGGNVHDVWLLCGDFNNVLSTDDRISQLVTDTEAKGFKDLVYIFNSPL